MDRGNSRILMHLRDVREVLDQIDFDFQMVGKRTCHHMAQGSSSKLAVLILTKTRLPQVVLNTIKMKYLTTK